MLDERNQKMKVQRGTVRDFVKYLADLNQISLDEYRVSNLTGALKSLDRAKSINLAARRQAMLCTVEYFRQNNIQAVYDHRPLLEQVIAGKTTFLLAHDEAVRTKPGKDIDNLMLSKVLYEPCKSKHEQAAYLDQKIAELYHAKK